MRCAEAMSLIGHTGHSEENHSPDECARTVVRRSRPASLSMRRRLDRRDLMPAKALAHDVQPARQRGIAEGAVASRGKGDRMVAIERLLRIGQLHLRLGKRSRDGSDRSLERCMAAALLRSGRQSSPRRTSSVWP